ncbi:MAG: hypothetical protein ABIF18_01020, partial [archaeon]
TIIATISTTGEFSKQIEQSDIEFYEGRKQISFESDIMFYNGVHYLYVYATRQGDFSVQISDVLYKENDSLKSITITKFFNVTDEIMLDEETNETSTEILSIKPGFVFTTATPTIKLINRGSATLNLTYGENELSLEPLATQEIEFTPEQIFSYFNISSYKEFSIPIIYPTANATFESPLVKPDLRHDPELLLAELFTNNETQETIMLFNFGNENITDIQASSDISFIEIEQPENMPARGIQNLTLIFTPEISGHFQGYVNISYTQNETQYKLSIPLSLFVLPEGSVVEDFEVLEETCEEISGAVCQSEETCEGKSTFTKNREYCCLGTCQPILEDEPGNYGWIIAIIIFAVLGGGGYYLYRKQKQVVPKKPGNQIKEASERFNKRMAGTSETKRISGAMGRS